MGIMVILEQMAKLFLILLLGVFLAKKELLDVHTKQKLTKLLLTVTTPMMMLDAFHDRMLMLETQENTEGQISVGALFAYSFAFYGILTVLSVLLVLALRVPQTDRRLYLFMTIFGNVGFMGFPVLSELYGTEGLFYAAILNSVFNILVYTFGVLLMNDIGGDTEKSLAKKLKAIPWKKLLLTPAVIFTALGVLIFFLHIHLPSIFADTCDTLGSLTSPLAMLVVGANLSTVKSKELLTDLRLDIYVLLRNLAVPMAFWLIMRRFVTHPVLAPSLLILCSMPAANTTALFATEYHGNEKLASQGIFLTTVFSLLSLPLILWITG